MRRLPLLRSLIGLSLFFNAFTALELPHADPASVGMSPSRLEVVKDVIEQYVNSQRVAGVVTLVARDGKIVQELNLGRLDVESDTPIPANAIFRIGSMTKPITSVAAMMLVEEGALLLSDPVSKYLPEYARTSVAVPDSGEAKGYRVVPARRPITLIDLLTHTSGISYGNGPAQERYQAANIFNWYFAEHRETIGGVVRELAKIPFDAQPGERFVYGFSTDILGHVIEVVSGIKLDKFFQQRIFDPLGMKDTHFYLPPENLDRFTSVYAPKEGGGLSLVDGSVTSPYVTGPRTTFSGGAGLLSTAEDYARFLQMLLNGGELDGQRILSPKSIELMTVNHIGDLLQTRGFGFGFAVVENLEQETVLGSPGSYGLGGAYYTGFWVDPREHLFWIFMSQLIPNQGLDLRDKFRNLVYQSLETSYRTTTR